MATSNRMFHIRTYDEHRLAVIKGVTSRFTYKPGWSFQVDQDGENISFHAISPSLSSTESWTDTIVLNQTVNLSVGLFANDIEEATLLGLRMVVRAAELHEMDEWCRYKGKQRWSPHRDTDF